MNKHGNYYTIQDIRVPHRIAVVHDSLIGVLCFMLYHYLALLLCKWTGTPVDCNYHKCILWSAQFLRHGKISDFKMLIKSIILFFVSPLQWNQQRIRSNHYEVVNLVQDVINNQLKSIGSAYFQPIETGMKNGVLTTYLELSGAGGEHLKIEITSKKVLVHHYMVNDKNEEVNTNLLLECEYKRSKLGLYRLHTILTNSHSSYRQILIRICCLGKIADGGCAEARAFGSNVLADISHMGIPPVWPDIDKHMHTTRERRQIINEVYGQYKVNDLKGCVQPAITGSTDRGKIDNMP